jgi:predicted enzyme related to lactoylglutathione lyase
MPAVDLTHGMFAWTDLIAHDLDDAKDFYGNLLGWRPTALPDHPASAYTLFTLDGQRVAGLTPMSETLKGQGVPPVWVSYILVDDVDAVVGRVVSLGGTVVLPPMDIEDSGRMSMITDPSGGSVCLWQAGTHGGAECFNDAGCMSWNELLTRDPDAALPFFADLLGWTYQAMDLGEQGTYQVCMAGGRPNGGIMAMPATVPDHVPAHWDVYFAVDDVDAAAARATEIGGQILVPPTDIAVGRFTYVSDRQGGHFTLFRPSQP